MKRSTKEQLVFLAGRYVGFLITGALVLLALLVIDVEAHEVTVDDGPHVIVRGASDPYPQIFVCIATICDFEGVGEPAGPTEDCIQYPAGDDGSISWQAGECLASSWPEGADTSLPPVPCLPCEE